jgi:acetate kinase
MNILVLNAGSGSQRCSLFQVGDKLPEEPLEPIWKGGIESTFPGQSADELLLTVEWPSRDKKQFTLPGNVARSDRIERLLKSLRDESSPSLAQPFQIDLVAHRVVHGGSEFKGAIKLDAEVEKAIEQLSAFAPLHNPANLDGIRMARKVFGSTVPQVAVFDTSFHQTLPEAATVYPGPAEWLQKGIRRYGFHGTSFRWSCHRAAQLLNRSDPDLRLIICHLGGGCSIAATQGGKSRDTTMGFTPLDGIAMCTRSGGLDPGILFFLLRENPDIDRLEKILNKQSGLKGLSGLAGDTRIIMPAVNQGEPRAKLAMDVFIHRLRAGIGQMLPALEGAPHALVFTDVIGEHEPQVRLRACEAFKFLGIKLDLNKNAASPVDADISLSDSPIKVLVIKSRENWQMVRESHSL